MRILELGPGENPRARGNGVVYIDKIPLDLPNLIVWDLENGLPPDILPDSRESPNPDDRFDVVIMSHLGEHIFNFFELMRDIHRVLRPGGVLKIWGPHYRNANSLADPTHRRVFIPESFKWFENGRYGSPCWKVLKSDFGLREWRFKRFKGPGKRIKSPRIRRLVWILLHLRVAISYSEFYVEMTPVK